MGSFPSEEVDKTGVGELAVESEEYLLMIKDNQQHYKVNQCMKSVK